MKSIIPTLMILSLAAFLATGVCAQEKRTEVEKVAPSGAPPTGLDQPMGQVPEEILIRFHDEPSHHVGLAHEHFLKKDYAKSAAEMRTAEGFVKLETARSAAEGEQALADAAARLEKLAAAVESGAVTSVDEVDSAFARVEHALALHHQMKAEAYWKANDYLSVGPDLKAAAANLKNSLKYAGGKVEAETDAAINDAKEVGQKLIEGARPADERIGAAIETLGDKIDEVGARLEQPKK
jgi:hypothetical protein